MPSTALRPCRTRGCPAVTSDGYCAQHPRQQYRPSPSGTSDPALYNNALWRRRRHRILANHPDCAMCGSAATDVDHIVPKAIGGSDEDDNLRSLCHRCHSRRTGRDNGFRSYNANRRVQRALGEDQEGW